MLRNLMSIAVVAGLVYGAYQVNLKYFRSGHPTQQKQIDSKMTSFVCPRDVEAFDPTSPNKRIGQFTKGTEIKVGANAAGEMKNVFYHQPDGKIIQALCRARDLTDQTAAATPLENKELKTVLQGSPGLKNNPNASWLGNGQMTIQQGCDGGVPGTGVSGKVVAIGQSGASKTLSGSFDGQHPTTTTTPPPPPPSLSPEQGIKQRARDLGTNQGSASP